jgi:hypothetical protein
MRASAAWLLLKLDGKTQTNVSDPNNNCAASGVEYRFLSSLLAGRRDYFGGYSKCCLGGSFSLWITKPDQIFILERRTVYI